MEANEDKLSISRKEMTEHLTLFFTHVRYTLTLMLSMFTSAIVSLGFGLKEFGSESHLVMYYKLYVSSYVYAARLHDSCASEKHPWFTDIMNGMLF